MPGTLFGVRSSVAVVGMLAGARAHGSAINRSVSLMMRLGSAAVPAIIGHRVGVVSVARRSD